ncbi:glycoside hydrolase family 38 N-terminal domain-containing protein [Ligilactobacillus acidipiscis]|uniref:Glycosyl hydrolase, family 38 n=1 Tax=Ligilactobacillus acidipiscis TaxID=89059 RepID=A0A1K1KR14_9LACO|nr:glycoside hydrolase family 38 C-terminal domain-containing protein [Ligilactobacillus acidipiscis]SFV41340.1 glycosyl hydrolase, family 38 [Ligilactobacillus acidipiscis]
MVKAHLVNHTHWDREWYFTTMDAQVLSEQLFTEVLDELEKNSDANFCLDGQVSVVDEYVEIHPEAKERIRKLVGEGRLFVGPWYTQTDALIPDQESIIRNLVIGMKDMQQNYGEPMKVGYLPDTFGFNAQMPTLLQQVGIDNFLFWRGTNFSQQTNSVYFRWRGLNEQEVLAIDFPFGYFTGQITPETKQNLAEFAKVRYDPAVKFESEHGNHEDVLMPSGIDQMNIIKNIKQTVAELNKQSKYQTEISTYPEFVDIIRKKKEQLPKYQGELRLPTYARVHRSIGSVRSQIKRENFQLEQKILKRVEPLCVIGAKVGVQIGNGLLLKLWKKLLECQAHDTLGGSVSDNVATDILHRFKEANELADGIENIVKKKIAQYLQLQSDQVLVFNTEPYEFNGDKTVKIVASSKKIALSGMKDPVITAAKKYSARQHILMMTSRGQEYTNEPEYYELEITGHVKLPALGYVVLRIQQADTEMVQTKKGQFGSYGKIEKGQQRLEFVEGRIDLIVNQHRIKNILSLVDAPNDGDTYDSSPFNGIQEQRLPLNMGTVVSSPQEDALLVRGSASLPANLDDYAKTCPKLGVLTYSIKLSFNENGQINAHLKVDNEVNSHRLRLCFAPQIETDEVNAQIQAGYVRTRNEPLPADWADKFVEKPVNLYNFDKSLTLMTEQQHFTFWGAGQKEYEYRDQRLLVTLMATTGQLGKPNLAWRPGRASGDTTSQGHIMMPTPLAQERGFNEFDFAFKFSNEKFTAATNNRLTREWLAPSVSYQNQSLNVFINRLDNKIWQTENEPHIPEKLAMLKLPPELDVSALYPAYSSQGAYILRLQNLSSVSQKLPADLLEKAQAVTALEEPIKQTEIKPYDLLSLKIEL